MEFVLMLYLFYQYDGYSLQQPVVSHSSQHVQYDQQRYNEERKELFQQLAMNPSELNKEDAIIQRDVQEIEQDEANDIDEMYDDEANNLRDYYGEDADGAYYEEDRDTFGED